MHGDAFLNNFGNAAAAAYGRFENAGPLPPGAMIAKDSFTVSTNGTILTGDFFLMEKRPAGFDPPNGDWRYLAIDERGEVLGFSKGPGAENVGYCATCHNLAAKTDRLFFMPKEVRR